VHLTEFSPVAERVTGNSAGAGEEFSEAVLVFDLPSVGESFPRIEWTVLTGGARRLRLERLEPGGSGVQSLPAFLLAAGKTLALTADADGRLNASIDTADVSSSFTNLDDSTPARLPAIPETRSQWQFRARGGVYDVSTFDGADAFAVSYKQVHEAPPAPSQLNARIPAGLSDIAMRCLAKSPAARYARGHDVADALIAFLRSAPEGASAFRNATTARRSNVSSRT